MDDQIGGSAANLWHILTTADQPSREHHDDYYVNSLAHRPAEDISATPYGQSDHCLESVGAAFELDNTEIPFVHANSLIGHANKRGSETTLVGGDDNAPVDSVMQLTPCHEFMYGLNEYVVDHDICGPGETYLPPLPPSPAPDATSSVITPAHAPEVTAETAETDDLLSASAQYTGEEALFDLSTACQLDVDDDLVDVATFLRDDHSMDCWCLACVYDLPVVVDTGSQTAYEKWWVDSEADMGNSGPADSDWEWATTSTLVSEAEHDKITPRDCIGQISWDEVFPCIPSSLAHRAW